MKVVILIHTYICVDFVCVCVVHSLQAKLYIIDATKIAVKAVPRVWQFVLCKLFDSSNLFACEGWTWQAHQHDHADRLLQTQWQPEICVCLVLEVGDK